ncbi:hypothetical protein HMPREF1544_10771 [Mucor circinelloides 1006PhL]|uniref:FAR1 domain-containing protein n=1 Tax=Mucor circinelloides f. circinelloides (strain 1006PhL) TaxID=1220926 RepID=S2J2T7_MUCC1|nr:hypothetical protein HMPREF1544_10771 [Mucor circinelloides 1006PhL]
MNNKLYYPDSPLPRAVLEKKYASSEEIVQILAEWAYENHFELVIRKNDKDRRVHLRCKFEGNSTPKDITDRQKRRKSVKADCPFILKITYSKKAPDEDFKWKALEQDCSKNKNAHNHSLTLEECQLLPRAKKFLIGSDTIY